MTNVGLNIQPPGDKLNVLYTDTTAILAHSVLVDSVRTDETSVSLLGSFFDPVFGLTTASFYTQFRLSKASYSFGTNPVVDSLMFLLDYKGIYGDSTGYLTLKIYEMADSINFDSNYYSNQTIATYPTELANLTFTPDLVNDVIIGDDTLDPHLRINLTALTPELANKLLAADSSQMSDNTDFLQYFYGLYLTVENVSVGGAIIYFEPISLLSKMMLFYHNDDEDSLRYDFVINSSCARFGHFWHDYSLSDAAFKAQTLDGDTTLGANICYVQALAGVRTIMRLPYIKNYYSDGNIAVNEARLFLKGLEPEPGLDPAPTLALVKSDSAGGYTILGDQLLGSLYFGGSYDSKTNGYWFRITGTVQELLRSTDPDYGFQLAVSGGAVMANRVVLAGTAPSGLIPAEDRMRLVITYTKLK